MKQQWAVFVVVGATCAAVFAAVTAMLWLGRVPLTGEKLIVAFITSVLGGVGLWWGAVEAGKDDADEVTGVEGAGE